MFYLDTPISTWINRYPALDDNEPLCDCVNPEVVAFRTKKNVGIVCRQCNTGTYIRSNMKDNIELVDMLFTGDIA